MDLKAGLVEKHKGYCDENLPSNKEDNRVAYNYFLICSKSVVKRANLTLNLCLIKFFSILYHDKTEEEWTKAEYG